jgi:uncharacterized protein (DUF488 family)
MEIYTIGFTKKTAEQFFGLLKRSGVTRLIDTRLNNVSQLAGFAKQNDLKYFLKELCQAEYVHEPSLAPIKEMLDEFKKLKGSWSVYEDKFVSLLKERQIEKKLNKDLFKGKAVLLCSEDSPEHCHRRLVAEYLRNHWQDVTINHLK